MLEQFRKFAISAVLRRGATAEEVKLAATQRDYDEAKRKAKHTPGVKNVPCVCSHASSQHPGSKACTAQGCDCGWFTLDEKVMAAMVEKAERKRRKPSIAGWFTLLLDNYLGDGEDEPEPETETQADKRARIQDELLNHSGGGHLSDRRPWSLGNWDR